MIVPLGVVEMPTSVAVAGTGVPSRLASKLRALMLLPSALWRIA